jgi:predicted DNA binding CopG/RHH family protein
MQKPKISSETVAPKAPVKAIRKAKVAEKEPLVMTTIRLKESDLALIREAADEKGLSMAAFIRMAVLAQVKQAKAKK